MKLISLKSRSGASTVIAFLLLIVFTFPDAIKSQIKVMKNEKLIFPETIKRFVILRPSGELKDSIPVLEIFSEDAGNKKVVENLFENSFMKETVKLYFLVQNYLYNKGILTEFEPAYLLLSNQQGGFPKFGFYLKEAGNYIDKKNVPYIDLVKNDAGNEGYLGSMTQIYPHEMGHILYQMLSGITEFNFPRSCDVHFSTITTDYRIAFHEGFAVHFENVSREYETNKQLKDAIINDFLVKKKKVRTSIKGYERDFKLPLRLDYYKTTMLMWYQNFEALKRYEWVKSGGMKYRNDVIKTENTEKAIFYRNSGIYQDTTKLRTIVQAVSTEGVIATFFTRLMDSDLKFNYMKKEFYLPFLYNSKNNFLNPQEIFTPLENEYLKIFVVLYKYVNSVQTKNSQFLDFVKGYVKEFPDEKNSIYNIFKFATGYNIPDNMGPEIWILNKGYNHGFLVMDQSGSTVIPFYTFNLNAADDIDLLTIKNMSKSNAQEILKYRDEKGFIGSIDEIFSIKGLSKQTAEALKESIYDLEYVNKAENEQNLNISMLVLRNVVHPFIRGIWTFILFLLIYYFAFWKRQYDIKIVPVKKLIFKMLKMVLFILFGLISVIFPINNIMLFLMVVSVYILIEIFIRKDVLKRKDALFTSFTMALLILYSLW